MAEGGICIRDKLLMYGVGGGEYMWRRDLRQSRSALSVSTQGGVISGVCTSTGGSSPGLQFGGVISGG